MEKNLVLEYLFRSSRDTVLFKIGTCYRLTTYPQNSHVQALTPNIWRQGLWDVIRVR